MTTDSENVRAGTPEDHWSCPAEKKVKVRWTKLSSGVTHLLLSHPVGAINSTVSQTLVPFPFSFTRTSTSGYTWCFLLQCQIHPPKKGSQICEYFEMRMYWAGAPNIWASGRWRARAAGGGGLLPAPLSEAPSVETVDRDWLIQDAGSSSYLSRVQTSPTQKNLKERGPHQPQAPRLFAGGCFMVSATWSPFGAVKVVTWCCHKQLLRLLNATSKLQYLIPPKAIYSSVYSSSWTLYLHFISFFR